MASPAAGAISGEEAPVATGKWPTLTEEERARVERAVQEAEQRTSAEIVPMVVGRSGFYREAHHRAGLLSALLVLTASLMSETAWLPWGVACGECSLVAWHDNVGLWRRSMAWDLASGTSILHLS